MYQKAASKVRKVKSILEKGKYDIQDRVREMSQLRK